MGSCKEMVLLRIFCILGSIKIVYSGSDNFHFDIGWEKPMPQGFILPENSNPKLRRIAKVYEDSAEKLPKEPIPIFEPNPPMKKVQFGFGIDGLLSWVKKSNSSSGSSGSSLGNDDCDEDEELNRIITWRLIATQMGDDMMADQINNILKDALKNGLCSGSGNSDSGIDSPTSATPIVPKFLRLPPGQKPEGKDGKDGKKPPKFNANLYGHSFKYRSYMSEAKGRFRVPTTTTTEKPLNDEPVVDSYKQRENGTNGKRLRKKQSKKVKQRNEMMEMLMDTYMSNKSDRKRKKAARSAKRRKIVRKNRPTTKNQKQNFGKLIDG